MEQLPNLLIVDDYKENLFLLEILIRKIDVNLIIARSGSEALEKTEGVELALAIIDVRMPVMNGYELALKMNERSAEKVPVIFLTASHFSEIEMFKGYGFGAADYIFKPIDNNFLLSKINVFLDLFNQKQTIKREAVVLKKYANELTRVNSALKKSEEKYRTMLNASPDGIVLIDKHGIITEISEIGLELFGTFSREEMAGKKLSSFVPSEDKSTMKEMIESTMRNGLTQNIGLRIRRKNKTVFPGELSATLIQMPDGTPLDIMIIIRDITLRKRAETLQMHADRMANLGEMASGIAHEINQPLNIISMVLDKILFETARKEKVDIEFIKEKADKIFENIIRIRNIIDHIRAFSRSHDDYILSEFNINTSIENGVSMISEQFKHLGISLDLKLGEGIPQFVGNTYKFEQVIVNLLANAKDALIEKKIRDPEFVLMVVGINSFHEGQAIIVEIIDNGIGIDDDDLDNVILPFYTTKDEGKGTGLGLSICYQIIKEMGGFIDIISSKTSGTKIRLEMAIQNKTRDGR
jgi:PAS domain S-box-containing protein